MATVAKDNVAGLSTASPVASQVEDRISVVIAAHENALRKLGTNNSMFFGQSAQADSHASALRQLRPLIDAWAARGRSGSPAKSKMGWPGWIQAGNIHKDGVNKIADSGIHERLRDIIAVVRDAPKHAAQDIVNGATKAAALVEGGGFGLVKMLWKPVAFVAVTYLMLNYVVRKGVG